MTGSGKFWTWFLTGLLVVLIVAGINLFIDDLKPHQWDLTEDKRYTLPEAAEDIASRLDDVCKVTCFFTDPLPSYLSHVPASVRTQLEGFRTASDDMLEFTFVDPEDESEEFRKQLNDAEDHCLVTLGDQEGGKSITGQVLRLDALPVRQGRRGLQPLRAAAGRPESRPTWIVACRSRSAPS